MFGSQSLSFKLHVFFATILLIGHSLSEIACETESRTLITRNRIGDDDIFEFMNISSTVSVLQGFRIVAIATFANEIDSYGWTAISIMTSQEYSDVYQAYWAGFLETNATRELTEASWLNTVAGLCVEPLTDECQKLKTFLGKNLRYTINQAIERGKDDEYWYQIYLQAWQLRGISDAYKGAMIHNSSFLTHDHLLSLEKEVLGIYLLQLSGDLSEILKALSLQELLKARTRYDTLISSAPSCSALIKLTKDNVYLSHVTWSPYNQMLRVMKHYNFPWQKKGSDETLIPGRAMTFSSYPSVISSVDDFYIMSSQIVTIETTNGNYNDSLWKFTRDHAEDLVLEPFRVMTANRLAQTGDEWVTHFKQRNSGTYNNQWMVFDAKRFQPGTPITKQGVLTVAEQIPGYVEHADVTNVLKSQSYWASYNVPYFENIHDISGFTKQQADFGDWYSYEKTARAQIFRRDHDKVKGMASMHRLMRYNDFKNDPLSRCNCTPPYTAEFAISARCDLNDPNGTYALKALGYRTHGGTDVKITDYGLIYQLNMVASSGPTYDDVPPFQWSKLPIKVEKPRMHPDLWNFPPVLTNFTDYLRGFHARLHHSKSMLVPVFN